MQLTMKRNTSTFNYFDKKEKNYDYNYWWW